MFFSIILELDVASRRGLTLHGACNMAVQPMSMRPLFDGVQESKGMKGPLIVDFAIA